MKSRLIFLIGLVSFALQAQGRSLYNGPFLSKTVGSTSCFITPTYVKKFVKDKEDTAELSLDAEEMSRAIMAASKQPLFTRGLHIRATDPAVVISAGDTRNKVKLFSLFVDSSKIVMRKGDDARDLIQLVRELCD